ncbi:MAG TPA: ribosome biogenesis GTP-binding protein YihA/YsxC [Dehalococcoidia bacterium]|nr:ribosome biogenesis GTP-binding protein YihA/YsxC [Dehalococcoidia bacterium]
MSRLFKAEFLISVADLRHLPAPAGSEVAFVGRSNAGKSSALNALTNRKRLAFVSKAPGRTQHINFFEVDEGRFLVDLPGYGFAGVPLEVKGQWDALVGTYLRERSSLAGLVLIMDSRHPLKPSDLHLLEWFSPCGKPVHVLLTKADKLSRQTGDSRLREVRARLAASYPLCTAQLFSSSSRLGLDEAREVIEGLLFGPDQQRLALK